MGERVVGLLGESSSAKVQKLEERKRHFRQRIEKQTGNCLEISKWRICPPLCLVTCKSPYKPMSWSIAMLYRDCEQKETAQDSDQIRSESGEEFHCEPGTDRHTAIVTMLHCRYLLSDKIEACGKNVIEKKMKVISGT